MFKRVLASNLELSIWHCMTMDLTYSRGRFAKGVAKMKSMAFLASILFLLFFDKLLEMCNNNSIGFTKVYIKTSSGLSLGMYSS